MICRVASVAALLTCVGCGAKPAPSPLSPATGTGNDAVVADPPPDLSPVPEPSELVLIGRLSRPRTLVETLASWAGLPIQLSDVLPPEMRELDHVVAWDAPIEIAGALDRRSKSKAPEVHLVASLGLASMDAALALARDMEANLTAVAPGVFRLDAHEDASCAISASVGPAPARLVCGEEWPDVEELLPYVTRALPVQDLGANELHVELRAEPLRRRHGREIAQLRPMAGLVLRMASLDNKRFDGVLADVAYALADELKLLATEVDKVELTAKLDAAGKALELGQVFRFHAKGAERSFLAETIQESGRRAGPPPEEFWKLPASASYAAYSVASDQQRFTTLVKSLTELLDAYLEHEKTPVSIRNRARRILDAYPSLLTGGVYAGVAPAGTPSLLNTGWTVGVVNQRADALTTPLLELSGLLADREFSKLLQKTLSVDPKQLPKMRSRVLRVNGFPARATAYTLDFPAELLAKLSDRKSKAGKAEKAATSLTIVVVPDGERSFVAYGPDQKQAVTLLESTRDASQKTLTDLPELAALRSFKALWGGFWSLEALAQHLDEALKGRGREILARAPNQGRSPWLMRVDTAEKPGSLAISATIRIPQGAFQDVASLVPELAGAGILDLAKQGQ